MDCMSSNDENTILFGCHIIIKERYAASCQVIIGGNDPQPVLYLSENKIWMCVLTDHDYWFRSGLICLAILRVTWYVICQAMIRWYDISGQYSSTVVWYVMFDGISDHYKSS